MSHPHAPSPLVASLTGFVTSLVSQFTVDNLSKLCTITASLIAIGYSIWKWRTDARKAAREEAAAAKAELANERKGEAA